MRTKLRKLGVAIVLSSSLQACGTISGDGSGFSLSGKNEDVSETEAVADAAISGGSYVEAARLYEKAAGENPKSASAYLGLGRSYLAMDQLGRAEFALTRARMLDKRNPEILNELGTLKLRRLRPAEAIEFYDEALRYERNNLSALTGRAVALDFLSRHAEAQESYREGLKYYPSNFVLMSNYGLSLALSGQVGAGISMMEELLRDPDNGDTVRSNLAIAYALDGKRREARAMLTGTMSETEISATLDRYEDMRNRFKSGKPIGYMVFS